MDILNHYRQIICSVLKPYTEITYDPYRDPGGQDLDPMTRKLPQSSWCSQTSDP